jgi:rhodanese-related sulfurtransferase
MNIARRPAGWVVVLALTVIAGGAAIRPDWRTPLEDAGIRFISAVDLHAMVQAREPLTLVDARDEIHYRREHLPGAISVPAEDAPLRFVDVRRPKRLLHSERLPVDRARLLVFYCGGPN